MSKSFLYTSRKGAPDGAPFLILHDRNLWLSDAVALADRFVDDTALKIAVQSPRAQSAGGSGITMGYFWYIGPLTSPELSTLGDGLYQLEVLLDETFKVCGGRKLTLVGTGEGGTVALLAGLIFPDKVRGVVALDAALPANLSKMPLDERPLGGLPVLLRGEHAAAAETELSQRGAVVTVTTSESDDTVRDFLAQLD